MTVSRLRDKQSTWFDLGVLATLALGLRLWGISFDLPNLYHRDEARYVSIPLQILKSGDYNPHFFNYPTLFFYLLAAAYVFLFLFLASRGHIGHLDGLVLPEEVLQRVVGRATMPSQFLLGRGLVALSGVLTVLVVYWVARRLYSRRAAWLAALLVSVSPTHVRNSHFIAPDVTMVLIAMCSFAFAYEVWLNGRRRDYVLAGLLAGLAASTKYNAYPILIPVALAHVWRRHGKSWITLELLLAIGAAGVGFLLGTPYALLDLPAFLNGVAFEIRHYATVGDPGIEGQNALWWYARYLTRTEGLVLLLAVTEALRGLLARDRRTLFLLSFPLVYTFFVSFYVVKNDRTILAIVPFLAMLAGAVLDRGLTSWPTKVADTGKSAILGWIMAAAITTAALAWPAWQTLQINQRFAREDVRTEVTQWMEVQLPPGSRVVGEYYSPLLEHSRLHFVWVDRAIDLPLVWYQENADYVVFVENRYGGFYLDPSRYAAQIAAYQAMFAHFALVKEWQGGALGNPCRAMLYRVVP
ncbi:MAG: phospholipid carrier-dependent glycosyltransferase [Chloroflexi bacterium]|nr:phospholipid carrier-dependent glycosyltransferase [Chloroflexota bacterium]